MKSVKKPIKPSVTKSAGKASTKRKSGNLIPDVKVSKTGNKVKSKTLLQMLGDLQPHDHLCLIYEFPEERLKTAIPFIQMGLNKKEKCFYITDSAGTREIRKHLIKSGVDTDAREKSGRINILDKLDVYTDKGIFNPDKMIAFLINETDKAIAEKYSALRIVFEMDKLFHQNTRPDIFLEYEAKLNRDFFPHYPCIAIGLFNQQQIDAEIIKGIIMTHPKLIKGDRIYHNFYYVPPVEFLNAKRSEMEVKHWLNNLEREQRTLESLQESEEKLHSIFRVAPTGIGMVVNRALVEANDRFCEMTGYTREELIGLEASGIYASQYDFEYVGKEKYRQIGEKGSGSVETRLKRKDGTIIHVFMSSTPIDPGDYDRGVVFTALDITDYKKAEQALEDEAVRRRILIEQSRDGIVILDNDGGVFEANKRFAEMLRYTADEVKELHVWDWDTQWPREHLMEMIRSVDEAGDRFETYHRRKDGTIYDVEISTNGAICGGQKLIFCVCRDITDRKQAELALHKSEEKYRQVVENATEAIFIAQDNEIKFANQRTAQIMGYTQKEILSTPFVQFVYPDDRKMVNDLYIKHIKGFEGADSNDFRVVCKSGEIKWAQVNVISIEWEGRRATLNFGSDITERKQLERERQRIDKLESVGTLAGGIAHDFNNILTGILGNISLAIMKAQAHNNDINEILKEAEKASLRAKDLTQQLLTFARGGAPVKKLMSVSQLISETVSFALRGSNVDCQFSIPDDLWQVEIDEGQIGQVISNLVLNARQSMPTGGMIQVKAENVKIRADQHTEQDIQLQPGEYIKIAVTDHGIGIPPQYIDKIFDPYFTTKQTGSGLGLATCYSIVHNHNGHIGVASEVGAGSTFYIYLPSSEVKVKTPEFDVTLDLPFEKGRVLIMDDEKVVTDIASRMLKYMGYADIVCAADGDEAIKLYRESMEAGVPFSVVILDLTIPGGKGGTETIKELLETDPEVNAIVSSGYSDNMTMARYSEFGFKAVVSKPYTIEELGKTLRQVMMEKSRSDKGKKKGKK
jgi:two-component system, cell cycle sensor histidine kinase and response regulator CckA